MVGTSSAPASLKEYLKKYTSNEDEEKKKKKKRKAKPEPTAVLVVDEDPIWQKPVKHDEEEEDSADEEKPLVDEDIEVKHMRRLEQLRSKRPFGAISEDGSGWVSVSNTSNNVKFEDQTVDISPPRKGKLRNDTPSPRPDQQSDAPSGVDLSPPRKRRLRNDTPSPRTDQQSAAPSGADLSPPRKRRLRNDTPSPKPEQQSSRPSGADLSPLRKLHKHYRSTPSESETKRSSFSGGWAARHDTPSLEPYVEASESDRLTDLSPPRRQRRDKRASLAEPGRISSHSKTMDSDISPPRCAHRESRYQDDSGSFPAGDISPPRKVNKKSIHSLDDHNTTNPRTSVSDLSPPRRQWKESPVLSRPKTGLISGHDIKDEIDRKQKEDLLRFREMDPSVSGRDAEPVFRNKITGERMSREEFLNSQKKKRKKEEKPKEIKVEWGKGLAQKREAEARLKELEAEKDKPFARSRDDPDLDAMLKERVRWGDPMAHLVKKKHLGPDLPDLGESEKMKESGFIIPQEIPNHSWIRRRLDAAPNRYGIKPGRHWDGVDRSNGYEKELFKRMNEKRATEREAYLWSVSDM